MTVVTDTYKEGSDQDQFIVVLEISQQGVEIININLRWTDYQLFWSSWQRLLAPSLSSQASLNEAFFICMF